MNPLILKNRQFKLPPVAMLLLQAHLFEHDQGTYPRQLLTQFVHQELTDQNGNAWAAANWNGDVDGTFVAGVRIVCTRGALAGFEKICTYDGIREQSLVLQCVEVSPQKKLPMDGE